jgi:hypothetical protein
MPTIELDGEILGLAAVLLLIAMAMRFPKPSPFQFKTLTIAIAVLSATLATAMPGLLQVEIPGARASGALAMLLLIALLFGLRLKTENRCDEEVTGGIAL